MTKSNKVICEACEVVRQFAIGNIHATGSAKSSLILLQRAIQSYKKEGRNLEKALKLKGLI